MARARAKPYGVAVAHARLAGRRRFAVVSALGCASLRDLAKACPWFIAWRRFAAAFFFLATCFSLRLFFSTALRGARARARRLRSSQAYLPTVPRPLYLRLRRACTDGQARLEQLCALACGPDTPPEGSYRSRTNPRQRKAAYAQRKKIGRRAGGIGNYRPGTQDHKQAEKLRSKQGQDTSGSRTLRGSRRPRLRLSAVLVNRRRRRRRRRPSACS